MGSPEAYSVAVTTPPAWWWVQHAAARLEAERQSPLDLAQVRIALKRAEVWRPGRPGRFVAVYQRLDAPEAKAEARPLTFAAPARSDVLAMSCAALVVGAAAVLGVVHAKQSVESSVMIQRADPNAPRAFTSMEDMVGDLSAVLEAAPSAAHISAVRWSPGKVTLSGEGFDASLLQMTIAHSRPHLQIVGSSQPSTTSGASHD